MRIQRIAGALGALVDGLDLRRSLSSAETQALRAAWLEHLVLFFRDQPLTLDQFMRFAESFGEPIEYPFVKGLPGYPTIIEVLKLPDERHNFGGIWHTDTAYLECPPMASMLIAREVPPHGGDTIWANQYLAFESLSSGMRRMLEGLRAVNSSSKADVSQTREDRRRDAGRDDARREYLVEHPVVRTHPETGRKALYVNVAHTLRFSDMSEQESAPLLQWLHQHQVRVEFTCRFNWAVGSLAIWDNRCTLHNPINDYQGYRRAMHRITLAGTRPA